MRFRRLAGLLVLVPAVEERDVAGLAELVEQLQRGVVSQATGRLGGLASQLATEPSVELGPVPGERGTGPPTKFLSSGRASAGMMWGYGQ